MSPIHENWKTDTHPKVRGVEPEYATLAPRLTNGAESDDISEGSRDVEHTLWLTAFLIGALAHSNFTQARNSSGTNCQPTQGGSASNEELRVGLPRSGRIVFEPGGPGFVTPDGSLGRKFLWERFVSGTLRIEGHRIDAEAAPMRSEIPSAYGDSGIQPTYLIFPQPGCWAITARVHNKPLSFVLLVEKIGNGPNWTRTESVRTHDERAGPAGDARFATAPYVYAGTGQALERPLVEFGEQRPDRRIQLVQAEEALVAQASEDENVR